jgi:hypothetical protein
MSLSGGSSRQITKPKYGKSPAGFLGLAWCLLLGFLLVRAWFGLLCRLPLALIFKLLGVLGFTSIHRGK